MTFNLSKSSKSTGKLVLVPTPLSDDVLLDSDSVKSLESAYSEGHIIAVEDAKPARRRWLSWGLPRNAIADFVLYNEHTREEARDELLTHLMNGKNVYLLSDEGLPAFCDPGQELVNLCHLKKIAVTSFPFANSVILALALSGFSHSHFIFWGFPPKKTEAREAYLKELCADPRTGILMDTPYRLNKLLSELEILAPKRMACLAMDLGSAQEEIVRGSCRQLKQGCAERKSEFVLVLDCL